MSDLSLTLVSFSLNSVTKMNNKQVNYGFVSLQKVELKNLEPNMSNILIVGLIIGKTRPKLFESTKADERGTRAVWNFTLRDSLQHYINVSYWGASDQVFQANDKFSTGDVVELINPIIMIRKLDDNGERFRPMVTSPYKLSLTEKSTIVNHSNIEPYLRLLHIPTKPTAVFVSLHDIHTRGASIQFADVLGAVRGLGEIRTIKTKYDEMVSIREIEVFDHSSPSLKISLWEPDLINRSNSWKPRTTILFLTDLKIQWSNFQHTYVASALGRTIVTEDPISKEAKILHEYAQSAPIETFDIVEQFVTSVPNSSAIEEVMNVRQVHDRINTCMSNKSSVNNSFTVTLFAFVSQLDLDGLTPSLITKCGSCKTIIKGTRCENTECRVATENGHIGEEISFDITIALSDHTGTLLRCKLSGQTAENALGCSAKEFHMMSDDEKCHLKWKYLLEQCKVRIAVIFVISQNPIISILEVEKADPSEIGRKLPVY